MTPKTTGQNLALWAAAFALAVLLSFLGALAEQLPGDAPINWRIVALNVVQTILSTAPIIAAGFGLPRLGKEPIASLVSQVGVPSAKAALEDEALRQTTGVAVLPLTSEQVELVADELERRMRATPAPDPLPPTPRYPPRVNTWGPQDVPAPTQQPSTGGAPIYRDTDPNPVAGVPPTQVTELPGGRG